MWAIYLLSAITRNVLMHFTGIVDVYCIKVTHPFHKSSFLLHIWCVYKYLSEPAKRTKISIPKIKKSEVFIFLVIEITICITFY